MNTLGEMLAELRKDHSLTQRQLANIVHVSIGTISNYEKGVHYPDIETLIKIADYFHVTTDYLLGRCESNLSVDVFQEPLTAGKTVGEIIQDIKKLPPDRKKMLCSILSDMTFRATIDHYENR